MTGQPKPPPRPATEHDRVQGEVRAYLEDLDRRRGGAGEGEQDDNEEREQA